LKQDMEINRERSFYLYTTPDCPYCDKAVDLIEREGYLFHAWKLDFDHDVIKFFKQRSQWKTVPIIFEYDDGDYKFIGGYEDLALLLGKKIHE